MKDKIIHRASFCYLLIKHPVEFKYFTPTDADRIGYADLTICNINRLFRTSGLLGTPNTLCVVHGT